jgi:hypothetical protein
LLILWRLVFFNLEAGQSQPGLQKRRKIEMTLPPNPAQQKVLYPVVVPNMANQVTFEGFLARAWTHNSFRFLRVANHRAPQAGTQSDGPLTVESDYVTIRLDPSVYFDMDRVKEGHRLMIRGRIEGHDIPETIGDILHHCNLNVRIPQDISHLTVTRPAVQVFCTSLEFYRDKTGNAQQSGQRRRNHRQNDRQAYRPHPGDHVGKSPDHRSFRHHPGDHVGKDSQIPQKVAPPPAPSMNDEIPAPKGALLGQDIAEVGAQIDARKVSKGKKTTAPSDEQSEPARKGPFSKKASPKAALEKPARNKKKEPEPKKTTK